jgi:hypothetical protein
VEQERGLIPLVAEIYGKYNGVDLEKLHTMSGGLYKVEDPIMKMKWKQWYHNQGQILKHKLGKLDIKNSEEYHKYLPTKIFKQIWLKPIFRINFKILRTKVINVSTLEIRRMYNVFVGNSNAKHDSLYWQAILLMTKHMIKQYSMLARVMDKKHKAWKDDMKKMMVSHWGPIEFYPIYEYYMNMMFTLTPFITRTGKSRKHVAEMIFEVLYNRIKNSAAFYIEKLAGLQLYMLEPPVEIDTLFTEDIKEFCIYYMRRECPRAELVNLDEIEEAVELEPRKANMHKGNDLSPATDDDDDDDDDE